MDRRRRKREPRVESLEQRLSLSTMLPSRPVVTGPQTTEVSVGTANGGVWKTTDGGANW
jgi:hypothetical protein